MTLTTEVHVHWPVPPVALLDHVTRVAGGDPATVRRSDETYRPEPGVHHLWNTPGQGLMTLATVEWCDEGEMSYEDMPCPPAIVALQIDNPYGGVVGPSGQEVQATVILPAIADWLDARGVPRDRWWWEDESAGTWHPGTTPVGYLATSDPREEWTAHG